MTAQELWEKSGLTGEYEAWAFGDAPDALAELTARGIKTATSSAYELYAIEGEALPRVGEYSVILNSKEEAVCIVKTTAVSVVPFDEVTALHAWKEGEDDRSLQNWRRVHREFFTRELSALQRAFSEKTLVVCEEFEAVFNARD